VRDWKPKKKKGDRSVTIGLKFRKLRAAKRFGKMPHEFLRSPRWSQEQAIAFVEAEQLTENYQGEY